MRAYLSVFKLRLIHGMQYRVAAYAGIATQFFWGFMIIMVFEAFYSSSGATQPMTLSQLVTYVWLQQSFLYFIMMWYRDHSLFDLITQGNIAYELCRPLNLLFFMVCQTDCWSSRRSYSTVSTYISCVIFST